MLAGGSKQEKEVEMRRRVQQAVGAVYGDNLTNAIFNDLPSIARSVRDENAPDKVHPFARVNQDDFRQAVTYGDNQGYEAVGNKIGLDRHQTKRMFAEGPDSQIWQAVMKSKGLQPGSYNDLFAELQSVQTVAMLQALDTKKQDGFSPAQAFVSLLKSPEARNRIAEISRGYGGSGFGAYLVSNSAGGGFSDAWDGYADGVTQSYTILNSKNMQETIKRNRGFAGDPFMRMNAVLSAESLRRLASTLVIWHQSGR
jgi:hypothetical protein